MCVALHSVVNVTLCVYGGLALEGGEVSADRSDVDSFSDEVVKPTKATDSVDREERSISM